MRGRIVNLASSIKQPVVNLILSNTYRVGIAGLAKKVYFELPSEGLLVNTLGPGRTSTERSAPFEEARAESLGVTVEELRAQAPIGLPLGRCGTSEEFAKVPVFLASPANTWVRKYKIG